MVNEEAVDVSITKELIAALRPTRELSENLSKLSKLDDYDLSELPQNCIDLSHRLLGLIETVEQQKVETKAQLDAAEKATETATLVGVRDEIGKFKAWVGNKLGSAKPAAVPDDAIERFALRISDHCVATMQTSFDAIEARLTQRQDEFFQRLDSGLSRFLNQLSRDQQEMRTALLESQRLIEARLVERTTAPPVGTRDPASPVATPKPAKTPSMHDPSPPVAHHYSPEPAFAGSEHEMPFDKDSTPSAIAEDSPGGLGYKMAGMSVLPGPFPVLPARKANMDRWHPGLNSRNSGTAFLYHLPSSIAQIPSDGPFTNPKDARTTLKNRSEDNVGKNISAKGAKCFRCQTVARAACA